MIRHWYMRLPARSRPRWLRAVVLWALAWSWPALAAAPAPAALPVAAELSGGALVVTWQALPGQVFGCVFARAPDRLLGCTLGAGGRYQLGPGSVDQGLRVAPGDLVEVRAYALTGEVVGIGEAPVLGRVRWLPIVVR